MKWRARAKLSSACARSLLIVIHGTETVAELTAFRHSAMSAPAERTGDAGLITAHTQAAADGTDACGQRHDIVPPPQQAKQLLNESAVAVLGLRAFRSR